MLRSLRAQLSLSILLILLVMVTLISAASNWFINREFEEYMIRQENDRSVSIVNDLGHQYNDLTGGWSRDFLHTIGMYSLYDGYILKIYGARGTRTYPISRNGKQAGSVSITYYGPYFFTENDYRFIKTLNGILLAVGLLSAAFAVAAGTLLARRIARPISKTAYIATQISQGNYGIRFESTPNTRELQEMVTAINHLAEALSEQESLRKRLTSDVAHELRTPLSAVSSHLEAMIEGIWEATPERLQSCQEEIKRLASLVADLQRLADIEDGSLKLVKIRVDLHEIALTAVRNLESEGMKKRIALSACGSPAYADADRERIIQVVMNLLSNALRYTPPNGRVEVETFETESESILRVKDTGIGIPEEELPYIFERFYRTDKSRNRKTGGTGIGLTIAKSIVESHGGKFTVESTVGEGSRFTVLLPKQR